MTVAYGRSSTPGPPGRDTARSQDEHTSQDEDISESSAARLAAARTRSGGSEIVYRPVGVAIARLGGEAAGVIDRQRARREAAGPELRLRRGRNGKGVPARRSIRKRTRSLRAGAKKPDPVRPFVESQQAAYLDAQAFVLPAGGSEPGLPEGAIDPDRGLEELANLLPAAPGVIRPTPPEELACEPGPRPGESAWSCSTVATEISSSACHLADGHAAEVTQGHDLSPAARRPLPAIERLVDRDDIQAVAPRNSRPRHRARRARRPPPRRAARPPPRRGR